MKSPRGIRGATTIDYDNETEVLDRTRELLAEMVTRNDINEDAMISIMFTATKDIVSAFPAKAARSLGWIETPLISSVEMDVENGSGGCIRVLMLVMSDRGKDQIEHVYLNKAISLRPDLVDDKC